MKIKKAMSRRNTKMNKTLALCLGIFAVLGLIGAVAEDSIITTITSNDSDTRAIKIEALANAENVGAIVDPQLVVAKSIKIGESQWGKYQASCQKARTWLFDNAVETTTSHGTNNRHIVGDYVLDQQYVNANGEKECIIKRYAQKEVIVNGYDDDSTKSPRKKVWDGDTLVGWTWRYQKTEMRNDWKIVDLDKPEVSYKDFLANLDKSVRPAPVFTSKTGYELVSAKLSIPTTETVVLEE
jgi:hypothetical protein